MPSRQPHLVRGRKQISTIRRTNGKWKERERRLGAGLTDGGALEHEEHEGHDLICRAYLLDDSDHDVHEHTSCDGACDSCCHVQPESVLLADHFVF